MKSFLTALIGLSFLACGSNTTPTQNTGLSNSTPLSSYDNASNTSNNSNNSSSTSLSSETSGDSVQSFALNVGQSFTYDLPDKNSQGESVVYQELSLPSNVIFDSAKKRVSCTPTAADIGEKLIKFTQISPKGTFTLSLKLSIKAANDPSNTNTQTAAGTITFTPIADQKVQAGKILTFVLMASSSNTSAVTVIPSNLPVGAVFQNMRFRWIPLDGDVGLTQVQFIAQAAGAPSTSITVQIEVTAAQNVEVPECNTYEGQVYQKSSNTCVCRSEYFDISQNGVQKCVLRQVVDTCESQNRNFDKDRGICGDCKANYFSQYVGYVGGMPTFACVENQRPTCDAANRTYTEASNSCGLCKPGYKVDTNQFRAGNYTCVLNLSNLNIKWPF